MYLTVIRYRTLHFYEWDLSPAINPLAQELLQQSREHFSHGLVNLLSLGLKRVKDLFGGANRDLILASRQLDPGFINELLQRHANHVAVLQVGLVLGVVQFCLHGRWIDFDDLDIAGAILQLCAQSQNEVVQSSLRGTIVRAAHHGNKGHLGGSECDGGLRLSLLEMRNEFVGETDSGGVVGDQLLIEDVHIDGLGLREVERPLDAGVDENTVQVGAFGNYLRSKLRNLRSALRIST